MSDPRQPASESEGIRPEHRRQPERVFLLNVACVSEHLTPPGRVEADGSLVAGLKRGSVRAAHQVQHVLQGLRVGQHVPIYVIDTKAPEE